MWRSTLIVFMPGLLKVYLKVVSFLVLPRNGIRLCNVRSIASQR